MKLIRHWWHQRQRRRAVRIMRAICDLHEARDTLLQLPWKERPGSVKKINGQIKKLEKQLLAIPQRP